MSFTTNLFFLFIGIFFWLWSRFPSKRYPITLGASLIFYGSWNPYYVPLLLLSSAIAFIASHRIHDAWEKARPTAARRWLIFGVGADLAILCYFKYSTFLLSVSSDLAATSGFPFNAPEWKVLLPVGVSFYTFQSISHTVDVYRKVLVPTRSFPKFLLFESYFPHLVAGPIQQANFLMPQVESFCENRLPTSQSQILDGLDLILRGYVKKLLVADVLATYVNSVFGDLGSYRLLVQVLATAFFAIQIYCDFSGYTDIARGLAKTMGFEFSLNFNYPYFSESITEFWRRWHISLSSWLRQYLYIPLGGNRGSRGLMYRNLLITMVLGGLWHGANYTFVLWGAYQGTLLVLHKEWSNRSPIRLPRFLGWVITSIFILFGWFIFRIDHVSSIAALARAFVHPRSGTWAFPSFQQWFTAIAFCMIQVTERFYLAKRLSVFWLSPAVRFAVVLLLVAILFLFSPAQEQAFIYFQF
jgi:D-alanyl-lipoteichoic acid acyltransferase DltB (MBOAT superfamily)